MSQPSLHVLDARTCCRQRPIPRSGCSLLFVNDKVYAFGGQVSSCSLSLSTLWAVLHEHQFCCIFSCDSQVHYTTHNVQEPTTGVILDELLMLDLHTWELQYICPRTSGPRPVARHSHTAGVIGKDTIIIFGGSGLRGPLNDVWIYCTQVIQFVAGFFATLNDHDCSSEFMSSSFRFVTSLRFKLLWS